MLEKLLANISLPKKKIISFLSVAISILFLSLMFTIYWLKQ